MGRPSGRRVGLFTSQYRNIDYLFVIVVYHYTGLTINMEYFQATHLHKLRKQKFD